MSFFETAARGKVLKVRTSTATRLKGEKASVVAEVKQARVKLDVENVCVAELEDRAMELKRPLLQIVLQGRIAKFNFFLSV